jgi:serine/threonine protein kinase
MQGGIGIPHMHWCGQEEDYNFIVLEELSYDMSKLLKKCGNKFTLKTTLLLGIEIISILQYYHFKNFIHCGIKPEHLMIGSGAKFVNVFLIDFATSIKYRDHQTLEHITEGDKRCN